jgi:U3 small nucleolar RNA-associated protein 3
MNYYILGQAKLLNDSGTINLQENEVLKKLTYYRSLIKQIEPIDNELKEQFANLEHLEVDYEDNGEQDQVDAGGEEEENDEFEGEFDDEEDEEDINGNVNLQEDLLHQNESMDEQSEPEDVEELSDKEDNWKKSNQEITLKECKKEVDYDSIANMLQFGGEENAQKAKHSEIEIKEVNKIIDKVIKKKKKVDTKKAKRANVDDIVSEEEDYQKIKKKIVKRRKEAQQAPVKKLQDTEHFGGLDQLEDDSFSQEKESAEGDPGAEKLQKVKEKKREKKEKRKTVVKGRIEQEIERQNNSIQNNMNRTIMKGKGLYRKRKKMYRNPRVKHKLKYEKALKKRNRMVQDYKAGPQQKYGGELTGIRSNIIKSTKL